MRSSAKRQDLFRFAREVEAVGIGVLGFVATGRSQERHYQAGRGNFHAADARRARATPLLAQDLSRMPDVQGVDA